MKRAAVLFLLSFVCIQMHTQDIVDKIIYARHLITDSLAFNPTEALSQLQMIEKECTDLDNDTLKAVFYELKGQTLISLEKYKECIPPCNEALRFFERCNLRQYGYLNTLKIIAMAYYRLGDFENAERYYRKGLIRSVAAKVNTTNQYRADLLLNLGNLYKAKGDSILANAAYYKSKQLSDSACDVGKWNYIDWENSCWDKIIGYTRKGKYQEAVDVYSEMIPVLQNKRGKDNVYILAVSSKGVLLSHYLNKYDEAIPLFKEVVEIGKNSSTTNESVCGAYCDLALSYAYKGDFTKTDTIIRESQDYLIRANNEYYPPHAIYRYAGNGAFWTKNYEKAIKYYEIYLSPQNKREPGNSYDEITNQISVSYILNGEPKKAKQLLYGFLKTEEKRLSTDNIPTLANIYHNLGRSVMLDGNKSWALKYLKRSKELQIISLGKVSERTLQYIEECKEK